MKSNCPELLVPRLVHISKINKQWIDVITRVCRQITGIVVFILMSFFFLNIFILIQMNVNQEKKT